MAVPVSIDWATIEMRLQSAIETGMQATIDSMEARAKNYAPIRKVFKGQKDITRGEVVRWKGRFKSGGIGGGSSLIETPGGAYRRFRRQPIAFTSPNQLNVRGRYELRTGRATMEGHSIPGGRLRQSIEASDLIGIWGGKYEVYLNAGGEQAPYAIYQELGTSHNKAHPFLRPALDEAAKYYQRYVERSIRAVKL